MDFLKKVLCRISHFLLAIIRVLRRTICCRRRKDSDYILPLTIDQVTASEQHTSSDVYEFHSSWSAWPETGNTSVLPESNLQNLNLNKIENQMFEQEENPDDFFKDMVPQIRKPKKIYIKKEVEEREVLNSNRLAMDPKAILTDPDLGIIDDNPTNWEDNENIEEDWDPNELIRENKRVEREKRLAEHQRRKQERESRRASKQDSPSNIAVLNLSDSRDKTKFS